MAEHVPFSTQASMLPGPISTNDPAILNEIHDYLSTLITLSSRRVFEDEAFRRSRGRAAYEHRQVTTGPERLWYTRAELEDRNRPSPAQVEAAETAATVKEMVREISRDVFARAEVTVEMRIARERFVDLYRRCNMLIQGRNPVR